MVQGSRRKIPAPPWDAPVASWVQDGVAQAACRRAGLHLIRDVAKLTAQELIHNHGFEVYEADVLHRALQGTDSRCAVLYGDAFYDLAWMYVREMEKTAEEDSARVKQILSQMFGVPINLNTDIVQIRQQLLSRFESKNESRPQRRP